MFLVLLYSSFLSSVSFASSSSKPSNSAHFSLFFQNSSKKAYLLHQAKQREFKQRQALALKKRKAHLKVLQQQKKLKNQIEELEFQSHLHPDKMLSLDQKLSRQEEAFLEHQNRDRLREISRKKAFLDYKKQHKKYEKRKKSVLQARLKTTQLLRRKFKPINQIAEIAPPFESL